MTFEIDHIGSTAVSEIQAKPVLDIALRSTEDAQIAAALVKLGYVDRGIRSGRLFIRSRDDDVRTHNLHLNHPDDLNCIDQITFRNALRSEPKLRTQFAALKQSLVRSLGDRGRGQYGDGETDFVKSVLQKHS
ncbi:hypothetical protein SUH3_23990 [Pseudosulfitobacter pseudonitzschiae]|uniref:Dephospho-CoA kinase/protein folding accessory domain-containing protein n=1 Tax=Pseudosulfitobacter pseudonitzschiae TaxID=1402135 RepID=A0A073JAT8_9RHOB|nr:hypothetical protein SUH3_23990 [Pseudosulfitobacter pseudonitzschiae]